MSHASWISPLFTPEKLLDTADLIATEINKDKETLGINCIAFTGMSGAIFAGLVSALTGLPIVMVRKGENCHSGYPVEFSEKLDMLNYVIVDDLISSGDTVKRIMLGIATACSEYNTLHGHYGEGLNHKLLKIYLYRDCKDEYTIGDDTYPVFSKFCE